MEVNILGGEGDMRLDRLNEMEHYIYQKGNASLQDLSEHFDVSINTVRRDIRVLLTHGTIKKVYGGVAATTPAKQQILISQREQVCMEEKRAIAQLAAEQIPDNATLYLDDGERDCTLPGRKAEFDDCDQQCARSRADGAVSQY